MPESQATIQPEAYEPVMGLPVCQHRFDVVCLDGQFILDLWECRYCGQRIRRKKLTV
jgi:hypothetical protein